MSGSERSFFSGRASSHTLTINLLYISDGRIKTTSQSAEMRSRFPPQTFADDADFDAAQISISQFRVTDDPNQSSGGKQTGDRSLFFLAPSPSLYIRALVFPFPRTS
jgi:hypothetical protein